jgi:hypothetical protein
MNIEHWWGGTGRATTEVLAVKDVRLSIYPSGMLNGLPRDQTVVCEVRCD